MSIRERSERFTESNPKAETRLFSSTFLRRAVRGAYPRRKKVVVYELYGLTNEEIEIVEEAVAVTEAVAVRLYQWLSRERAERVSGIFWPRFFKEWWASE